MPLAPDGLDKELSLLEAYEEFNRRYKEKRGSYAEPYPYITWDLLKRVKSKTPISEIRAIVDDISSNKEFQGHLKKYHLEKQRLDEAQKEFISISNKIETLKTNISDRVTTAYKEELSKASKIKRLKMTWNEYEIKRLIEIKLTTPSEVKLLQELNNTLSSKYSSIPETWHKWASSNRASWDQDRHWISIADPSKYEWAYKTFKKLKWMNKLIAERHREAKKKAKIAAYDEKSRDLGYQIRNALRKELTFGSKCPYCDNLLDDKPHCDHIHPISHGGLSTNDNMVFVCSSCNLAKGDLTLREFIINAKLDRELIEQRLLKLGKNLDVRNMKFASLVN